MSFTTPDEITYESFIQQNLCRLCWLPLGGDVWLKTEHNNDIFDKVLDCLGINLYDNMIPNKICDKCITKLESFSEYKTSCIRANDKLLSIFEYHENKLDVVACSSFVDEDSKLESIKHEIDFVSADSVDSSDVKKEKIEAKVKIKAEKKKIRQKRVVRSRAKRTPTYCNICCTDFKTKGIFLQHCAEAHGIEENGTKFKCFSCERRFNSRGARLRHEIKSCEGLKNGYMCNLCEKYIQSRGIYEKHMLNHRLNKIDELPETPEFKCRQCDQSFNLKSLLDSHKLSEHTVKRDFVCELCGRIFNKRAYLQAHRIVHGDIKRYSCTECDYVTRQKTSLNVHMKKHTGERPFSCDMCELKCVSSSNLAAHRKRHLGVKDFECTICSKKFGYKASLEDHMFSIHGEGEPTQKYCCSLCGAIFPRQSKLNRHLRKTHKSVKKARDSKESVAEEKHENSLFSV